MYEQHCLAPTALLLFRNASVLAMPFAELGTLVDVLRALAAPGQFSAQEHEILAASLAKQMLEAVMAVHAAAMLHCDIKSGNAFVRLLSWLR